MTKVLDHGHVTLIDSMPSAYYGTDATWGLGDQRIVDAARVSVSGGGVRTVSDDRKLLGYLYTHKHTSPFEKVRFEFEVKAPIFVARQWVRHRMSSTNEMSARYSELPADFYVPAPERMQSQATVNKQGSGDPLSNGEELAEVIREESHSSYMAYRQLLDAGVAREIARMVLPTNIYTKWWWTIDLHNLMHFLRLRMDAHAQHEIQVYARAILELIRPIAPATLALFEAR